MKLYKESVYLVLGLICAVVIACILLSNYDDMKPTVDNVTPLPLDLTSYNK